ncbi:MAG: MFS transporter [Terracoccus sp.]
MTTHKQDDSDVSAQRRVQRAGATAWVLPREVKVLLLARFVNRLGAFSLPFLAALLVTRHGVEVGAAGLVVGAFGLATIPSRLIGGRLATRRGARFAVVTGLAATAVAQLLVAAAGSAAAVTLAAVLLGLSFELYEPASQALIADVTPRAALPAVFGVLGAMLAVAGIVAGLLAAVVGRLDLRLLFVVDAATCLACAGLVLLKLSAASNVVAESSSRTSPWSDSRLRLLFTIGVLFATVYITIPVALPLTLAARGLAPSDAGLLGAAAAATIALGLPLLRPRHDLVHRMAWGHVVLAAGLVLTAVSTDLLTLLGASVVVALGDLLLLGCSQALVASIAPPGDRATWFAAHGLSWGVALTIGPPIAGVLLATGGPRTFWLASAVVTLAAGAALGVTARRLALRMPAL